MAPYQYPDHKRLTLMDRFLLLHQNYGTHYQVKSEVRPRLRVLKITKEYYISLKEKDVHTPHTHRHKLCCVHALLFENTNIFFTYQYGHTNHIQDLDRNVRLCFIFYPASTIIYEILCTVYLYI